MKRLACLGTMALLLSTGASAVTIFQEDFTGAVEGFYNPGAIAGTGFNVVSGSVDILGPAPGSYGHLCVGPAAGKCLDTQGSGQPRGTIETALLNLAPGLYQLSFSLVRWNDAGAAGLQDASIRVTLGSLFDQTYAVDGTWTNQTVITQFAAAAPTMAALRFTDQSGSAVYAGAILDNVSLDAVPEPGTVGLIALGFGALLLRRKQ